ncbi:hypothetical protein OG730_42430 (plasmid) [Streptomyces sp. NBC_01298]|uniref:hypothetical protein n=1 Tax=Streptomyces sp. NBC_01298 TaxID=2903817 RepID=UPI002E0E25D8|nr:hypothetical protein OG730_42430 [Streptomyces sp. NBC_01298]
MTTPLSRSNTVTVRIDTEPTSTPVSGACAEEVYEVTVFRTEMITFCLRAASAQDAEERYLTDGEETVSLNVDSTVRVDPAPAPAAPAAVPALAPVMSAEEYQLRTLEELADDIIVDGVAYSRTEWDRIQDGVHHTTTDETPAPAAQRTRPTWNGTDAPF